MIYMTFNVYLIVALQKDAVYVSKSALRAAVYNALSKC